jgi:phosphatidylglycerol---prolipoprotein diacylglyceryl transferase
MSAPFTIEPFKFDIGPVPITGFGLAVLLAFGIAHVVCQRTLAARGYQAEADAVPDIVTAALLGTLVGAKLYYVALTRDLGAIFSRGGFVFWGGFIGSVLFCWITIRRKGFSFFRFADVAGIAIAAGYAVGRTGCWAVGDDYGKPWDGPLAVKFPHGFPPSTADNMVRQFGAQLPASIPPWEVIAVHPTQLYEVTMGFVMFGILWRLREHNHREGWLFGVYCVLAGIERFIVEFYRAKDDRFAGPLSTAQMIAIAIMVVGVAIMVALRGTRTRAPGELSRATA